MFNYYEVHDGFTLEYNVPIIEVTMVQEVDEDGEDIGDPDESDSEEVGGELRRKFFKKSDGWTRELMDKMIQVFSGEGI
jgi:hypothetical protein